MILQTLTPFPISVLVFKYLSLNRKLGTYHDNKIHNNNKPTCKRRIMQYQKARRQNLFAQIKTFLCTLSIAGQWYLWRTELSSIVPRLATLVKYCKYDQTDTFKIIFYSQLCCYWERPWWLLALRVGEKWDFIIN